MEKLEDSIVYKLENESIIENGSLYRLFQKALYENGFGKQALSTLEARFNSKTFSYNELSVMRQYLLYEIKNIVHDLELYE